MAYRYIVYGLLLSLWLVLPSCEMKKDLFGQIEKPTEGSVSVENAGLLDLELKAQKEADIPASKGGITGSDVVVLDVNEFAVDILDSIGNVYKHYNSYADLKKEGGLLVPMGKYSIRATLGDDVNAGFDAPFYSGASSCEINPKEVAKVIADCVLSNKKVQFRCSDKFLAKFEDDYSIVVDNGSGILTTHKNEMRATYLKNTETLRFTVYSTTRNGKKDMVYAYDMSMNSEVKEHNNILVDLGIVDEGGSGDDPDEPEDPGDPDPGAGAAGKPKLSVDISLIEKDYVIEIPSDFVSGGDEPEDPSGDKEAPTIAAEGFSFASPVEISKGNSNVTVRINIKTPKKLASLTVSITSSVLEPLLKEIGLGSTFDMCNLSAKQASTLTELGLAIPEKGGTSTVFDISAFMPMIALLEQPGDYLFKISVADEAGKSASKTLTVKMK